MSAPILCVGRKRAGWAAWELLPLIIPFCVWADLPLAAKLSCAGVLYVRRMTGHTAPVMIDKVPHPELANRLS